MRSDCFIFDFDGTLAHSEPVYREAFRHSVRFHTGQEMSEGECCDLLSTTPREVLRRYSEELVLDLIATFEEHYYAHHQQKLTAYDGIVQMLESLRAQDSVIAIVSLKPRRAGEMELDVTGLRNLVDYAVWGDDVDEPKPHPGGVFKVLNRFQIAVGRAIVVGDSASDIMMGRAAGVRTAAALWSGSDPTRLLEATPDLVFNSPAELAKR